MSPGGNNVSSSIIVTGCTRRKFKQTQQFIIKNYLLLTLRTVAKIIVF